MANEISEIIKRLERIEKHIAALKAQLKKKPEQARKVLVPKRGVLTDQIMALREDGFFDEPRTITDVKIKLAERGYSCPVTTLSPILLGLVRGNQLKRGLTPKGFEYKAP